MAPKSMKYIRTPQKTKACSPAIIFWYHTVANRNILLNPASPTPTQSEIIHFYDLNKVKFQVSRGKGNFKYRLD